MVVMQRGKFHPVGKQELDGGFVFLTFMCYEELNQNADDRKNYAVLRIHCGVASFCALEEEGPTTVPSH